ncbi:heparin-sulfate lyase HepC [Pedobacter arcticus]|uniref:heparin-sulfate lyase HepC n=1 Tax=Pedobacter arcticus TaxID=752140 RepID=UPI000317271C|nr:heparin-sulfate lyase HepC [Pedobacter arcticus]
MENKTKIKTARVVTAISSKLSLIICGIILFSVSYSVAQTNNKTTLLAKLDLNRSGLAQVKTYYLAGKADKAIESLLVYYKTRKNIIHPDLTVNASTGKPIVGTLAETDLKRANDALNHTFFVMNGYPAFDYGKDINWQYWPVKDNELKWQIHRMAWWDAMAKTYTATNDERYAKEWVFEYADWVRKNPIGLSEDNDNFAWRSLEVSERLELQSKLFFYFINSKAFDEDFLVTFLTNYAKQAERVINNYSTEGNHLLFQAQRVIYAGTVFPELADAKNWQKSGITKLNEQIGIQVFADGMHDELAFHYHIASANTFYKALRMLDLNGIASQFPQFYLDRLEKMMMAVVEFSFPDYSHPMFSDSWLTSKSVMMKNFKDWSSVYPNNKVLKYFATDGKEGSLPNHTSHRLPDGGIYAFRSGWDTNSTNLILKASKPAFWHSQPDNGTFEIWVKGRNFMPDPGAFLYSGNAAVNKQRDYFRQTKLHNTLTLDNQNLTVDAKELKWSTSNKLDVLVYENPSYENLKHRRSVFFVNKKFFVIADEAIGKATGDVAIHFAFKEGVVDADYISKSITTTNADLNNITLKTFAPQNANMVAEENFVSYKYNEKIKRPAFAIQMPKTENQTPRFLTVIVPFSGIAVVPSIDAKFLKTNGNTLKVKVTVDGKSHKLKYHLR